MANAKSIKQVSSFLQRSLAFLICMNTELKEPICYVCFSTQLLFLQRIFFLFA